MTRQTEDDIRQGHAMDFLMEKASACDIYYGEHFWHICDGIDGSCGCPYEGEGGQP